MIWAQLPQSKAASHYSHFSQSKRTTPSLTERNQSHLWWTKWETIYYLMTRVQISPEKTRSIPASWVTNKAKLAQSKSMTKAKLTSNNSAKRSPSPERENFPLISKKWNVKELPTSVQKKNLRSKLHSKNKWLQKILFLTLSQVKKQNYFSILRESYFCLATVPSLTKGKTSLT